MAGITATPLKTKKLISYRYQASTIQGKIIKGTIKAVGEIEAERLLIGQGYHPLNVEVVPSMFSLEEALPSLFQIKPRDVIVFSRQLATLLKSGISLLPALEILQGQVTNSRAFKKILGSIVDDIGAGSSFTQSIAKHPNAFSEIYCRTVAVGEQTGNLELVLNRMGDYLERQGAVAKKVKGALTYPMMVLGVGLVVGVILMVVVMPQLLGMFESLNVELPLPTRILIGVTEILTGYPLYFLIGGAALGALALWLVKQPTGRRLLDRARLKAPLIGPPTLMGELARFTRTMSVLIAAGLSLQEIMELIPQSSDNRIIRDALNRVGDGLVLGEGLSEPMSRIDIFPPLLIQMVAVGEESNTLDFTLDVVADFYEVTAEEKTNSIVGMIGPLSTIFIALFVGLIAISVLMPMYAITGSFG
ncbi:MAG: type II secretion system F family protein [Dehalococcoidales bacterium]|nr:type II secretion system F family protein [Dehalococcoidales bacterium]